MGAGGRKKTDPEPTRDVLRRLRVPYPPGKLRSLTKLDEFNETTVGTCNPGVRNEFRRTSPRRDRDSLYQ